jgi:Tfp pilus assembly protein PilF
MYTCVSRSNSAGSSSTPFASHLIAILVTFLACFHAGAQPPAAGFNELGTVYFKEGRYAEALDRFEKALQLAPSTLPIQRNIVLCHQALAKESMDSDDLVRALSHLKKAIAIDPENPDPHVQAGVYLFHAGKLPEARKRLQDGLKRDPSQHEARATLGEILYQNGQFTEARKHWAKVLKDKPDWPGLQKRLDKLDRETSVEAEFENYTSEHFQISYGKVLSEATRTRVFAILEDAYDEIGEALGGIHPTTRTQVVLYDGKEFSKATLADRHVGALFDGKIRAPITNQQGRYLSTPTLTNRLRHEYVHAAIRFYLGESAPWWLNEGLAETLSRKVDQNRFRTLRKAYRNKETFSFIELEVNPRKKKKPKEVSLAYAQVHVAVDTLWSQQSDVFPALLQRLKAGVPTEEALRKGTGLGYAELNEKTERACAQ